MSVGRVGDTYLHRKALRHLELLITKELQRLLDTTKIFELMISNHIEIFIISVNSLRGVFKYF